MIRSNYSSFIKEIQFPFAQGVQMLGDEFPFLLSEKEVSS